MRNFKTLILTIALILSASTLFALPTYFYGNIAIKTDGTLVTSSNIQVRITLYDGATLLYQETFNPVAVDAFGAFTVEVGTGTLVSGTWPAGDATVNMKTKAEINYGSGWVSLGSRPTMQIIYASTTGFSGDPSEINVPNGEIIIGDASGVGATHAVSGDATISNTGVLTLATTGVAAGKYGDGTHVAQITVNGKGRLTSASDVAIAFPAETDPQVGPFTTNGQVARWNHTNGYLEPGAISDWGGAVNITGTLGVTGNATVGGTLGVTGATTLAGLTAGATTLASAAVTGNATVGGTLGVTGNLSGSTANFSGTVTAAQYNGNLQYGVAAGNGLTGGTFNNSANNTFTVNEAYAFNWTGNQTWAGTATFNNGLTANTATVTGNATVGGTLGVTGATTLAGLTAGATTLASATVTGNATVGGTLGVTGALTGSTGTFTTLTATTSNLGTVATGTWQGTPIADTYVADNITIDGGTVTTTDNKFKLQDNVDVTKQAQFELSGITTGTTRTYSLPNADGTIALTSNITLQGAYDGGSTITGTSGVSIQNTSANVTALDISCTNTGSISGSALNAGNASDRPAAHFYNTTSNASYVKPVVHIENINPSTGLLIDLNANGLTDAAGYSYGIDIQYTQGVAANTGAGINIAVDDALNGINVSSLGTGLAINVTGGAVKLSYNAGTVSSNALTIPNGVSVYMITSDNNGTNDVITMPIGVNGQFLYVVYTTSSTDNANFGGIYTTTQSAQLTFVYAGGAWRLISYVE